MDNDGFSDAEETAYGSDPNDEESIPNSAPTNISGSLSVSENAEIGSVVGTVSVTDPDEGQSFRYSLVSRPQGQMPSFGWMQTIPIPYWRRMERSTSGVI